MSKIMETGVYRLKTNELVTVKAVGRDICNNQMVNFIQNGQYIFVTLEYFKTLLADEHAFLLGIQFNERDYTKFLDKSVKLFS